MGRGCSWTVRLCIRGTSSDEERKEEGGWFITKGGMERVREENTTQQKTSGKQWSIKHGATSC